MDVEKNLIFSSNLSHIKGIIDPRKVSGTVKDREKGPKSPEIREEDPEPEPNGKSANG